MYVCVHTRIQLYLQDGLASPSADLVFTLPLPTKHQICRFKAFQRRHGGQVLSPPRDKSPARRASPDGGCRVKQKEDMTRHCGTPTSGKPKRVPKNMKHVAQ